MIINQGFKYPRGTTVLCSVKDAAFVARGEQKDEIPGVS